MSPGHIFFLKCRTIVCLLMFCQLSNLIEVFYCPVSNDHRRCKFFFNFFKFFFDCVISVLVSICLIAIRRLRCVASDEKLSFACVENLKLSGFLVNQTSKMKNVRTSGTDFFFGVNELWYKWHITKKRFLTNFLSQKLNFL